MDKKSTFGLKLGQLADLFNVGIEKADPVDQACDDQEIADLLQSQLTTALPKDLVLFDSVLMMMGRLGCDARSLAGKSLGEILLDSRSDIGLLQIVKDYTKEMSSDSISEAQSAVAIALYYASLASSLVYHNKKITKYSYEALAQNFASLADQRWMAPQLAELFTKAIGICKEDKLTNEEQRRKFE
jgi:hypothetical protein